MDSLYFMPDGPQEEPTQEGKPKGEYPHEEESCEVDDRCGSCIHETKEDGYQNEISTPAINSYIIKEIKCPSPSFSYRFYYVMKEIVFFLFDAGFTKEWLIEFLFPFLDSRSV